MNRSLNWKHWPPFWVLVALIILLMVFAPLSFLHWKAMLLAFLLGCAVGMAEVVSRYRDEPLKATLSPFGLVYIALNGAISIFAVLLVYRYPENFGFSMPVDPFLAGLLAGLGASAVMRTRLVVLKSNDNKDVPIGPDFVIKSLLQMVDQYVDRTRAAERQRLVMKNYDRIRSLGTFVEAADYLMASLFAFQNMDGEKKKELNITFAGYQSERVPEEIKYLALGFVFLTLVGEAHFEDVLAQAIVKQKGSGAGGAGTNPGG